MKIEDKLKLKEQNSRERLHPQGAVSPPVAPSRVKKKPNLAHSSQFVVLLLQDVIFDFLTGGVSGLMPNGLNRIDADDPELSDYNMVPGMPTHSPCLFDLVVQQLPKQFTDTSHCFCSF